MLFGEGLVISWFLLCVFTIAEFIIGYSFVKTLIECKNRKKQETNDEDDSSCYETNSSECVKHSSNPEVADIKFIYSRQFGSICNRFRRANSGLLFLH